MNRSATYFRHCFFLLLTLASLSHLDAATFYWFGGSGDWTDVNHWSKESGNIGGGLIGRLPGADDQVIIDGNSSSGGDFTLTIPPGTQTAGSLTVEEGSRFQMTFAGSSGNVAKLEIYDDLVLHPGMQLTFIDPGVFHNVWTFRGETDHDITTAGKDLSNVEFLSGNAEYNLQDAMRATERIRLHGGTWNTNGHTVNTGTLFFQDNNGSGNPLTKVVNAAGSDFRADLWRSRFAYQSLTVNGDHQIFVKQFIGSPGSQFQSFSFDEIHLLDLDDDAPAGTSQIEYNNLDCSYCTIDKIIIEDPNRTQLAGPFTVETELQVTTPGAEVLFNGGNGRSDVVIINGTIKTPKAVGCNDRVAFSNVYNDFTNLTRPAGTLRISDAILTNIQADGGATFELSNGILQGSSSGWTLVNTPQAKEYVWIGAAGVSGDWNVPGNWQLADGSNDGCLPSIVDNVTIDNRAKGDLRIPSPYLAECHDFTWTTTRGLTMTMDGQNILESELKVAGDFELDPSAIIMAVNNHELIFAAAGPVDILTQGVDLPDVFFEGDLAVFNLLGDLTASQIFFAGGTLNTDGQDITTDQWRSVENNPKQFNFGSSHITVNGAFTLANLPTSGVTCDPGTSFVECEQLINGGVDLYDVKLINPTTVTLDNFASSFNQLILAGAAPVITGADLTLNELEFTDGDSELRINPNHEFTLVGGISSLASKSSPATLGSAAAGNQATINKVSGNLCVAGFMEITDIEAALPGIFHAPSSLDNGNNANIEFSNGSLSTASYWIAGTGDWNVMENWSNVSGGCPGTRSPGFSSRLVFDNNSLFEPEETITVSSPVTANEVYFLNSSNMALLIIDNTLEVNQLVVNGGQADFAGATFTNNGDTMTDGGGILITNVTNFSTNTLTTNGGIMIVRRDSRVEVTGQQ